MRIPEHLNRDGLIHEIDEILGRDDFMFSERLLEHLVARGLATHDPAIEWLLACDDSAIIHEALALGGQLNTSFTLPELPASWISKSTQ